MRVDSSKLLMLVVAAVAADERRVDDLIPGSNAGPVSRPLLLSEPTAHCLHVPSV